MLPPMINRTSIEVGANAVEKHVFVRNYFPSCNTVTGFAGWQCRFDGCEHRVDAPVGGLQCQAARKKYYTSLRRHELKCLHNPELFDEGESDGE